MEYKKLQQIIKLAKRSGIKHLKIDGVELNFIEEAVTKKPNKSKDDTPEIKNQYDEMSAVLWSSQDYGTNETN